MPSLLPQSPLPSLPSMQPSRRGWSNELLAFNAWKTACTDVAGLLSAFVEQVLSSLPIECSGSSGGGSGSGGTIARSATMHLVGAGRINSVNYSTCLHRLARVVTTYTHLVNWEDINVDGGVPKWSKGGSGHCRTCNLRCWYAHRADGLRVGPGHICPGGEQHPGKLGNGHQWQGGQGQRNEAGEADDILGTITGGGGGRGANASAQGGRQQQ
jgi:hypothetical protein